MPCGYSAGALAYQRAVATLTADALTTHYTHGLRFFHEVFLPELIARCEVLTGGIWNLRAHRGYAAGSDVDFMTHIVEAVAPRQGVALYPGDWYGFLVGTTQQQGICWTEQSRGKLACVCVPSVRNGHVTDEMLRFLHDADACLLNLNLYPTLTAEERRGIAEALAPVLEKSILSISFSRGFGLTASQLGVILVPQGHPFEQAYTVQWNWFTYFYNAIAARAFMELAVERLAEVDALRRAWVMQSLQERGLPVVATGSYYVKSFRLDGAPPSEITPLVRDGVVRLCFKPPQQ